MIVIDATNLIAGRLASYVAKQALLGEEVRIINSEKAVISGKKQNVFQEYLRKRQRGTPRGPFYPKRADRILKRIIRGMLPYKKAKGREAFKRIKCYIGIPDEFKEVNAIKIDDAHVKRLSKLKYVSLETLSKRLGAKIG